MKVKITPEMRKWVEDAFDVASDWSEGRRRIDEKKAVHEVKAKITDELVDTYTESPEQIAESIAGQIVAWRVSASRKNSPRFKCDLLPGLSDVIVPDELTRVSGWLVAVGDLRGNETDRLRKIATEDKRSASETEKYWGALSSPQIEWESQELSRGRQPSGFGLMVFLRETGHLYDADLGASEPRDHRGSHDGDRASP